MLVQTIRSYWTMSSTLDSGKRGLLDRFMICLLYLFGVQMISAHYVVFCLTKVGLLIFSLGICRTSTGIHDCSQAELWGENSRSGIWWWTNLVFNYLAALPNLAIYFILNLAFLITYVILCSLKTLRTTMLLICCQSMVQLILFLMMTFR